MTEIQWTSGKEEYSVADIECMIQSQRAMIHNDILHLLVNIAEGEGLRGKLTSSGSQIMAYLKHPRTVEI